MELGFLQLLLLCIAGSQAQVYKAVEGQSLVIDCPYSVRDYRGTFKIWCHMRGRTCFPIVSTSHTYGGRYQNKVINGRTKIQDDTSKGIVTITMEELRVQDSGVYSCAVLGSSNTIQQLKAIKLDVSKVQEYNALEGESLSVQCPYNTELYKKAEKFWCRQTAQNPCAELVSTEYRLLTYHNGAQSRRATIHDNTETGIVTVTMEKLQTDDTGVYWCMLYESLNLYKLIEVKLRVTKATTTSDTPVTSSTDHLDLILSTANAGSTPLDSSLSNERTFIILGVLLGVLFVLALSSVVILHTRKSRKLQSRGRGQAEGNYEEPRNPTKSQDFSNTNDPKDDKQVRLQDLKYATLTFKSQPSPKESIYVNVMPSQELETPYTIFPTESVEYSSISLKPLASGVKL